jgi:D-alanine-D-alanine ligase
MPEKKNIAFVTGGYSTEAVISYKSAITIENNLDKDKYNIYKIDITPNGWWHEEAGKKIAVDKTDFTIIQAGKNKIRCCIYRHSWNPGRREIARISTS